MVNLQNISNENWKEILYSNLPDDDETVKYLHEHEEEILDKLVEHDTDMSLDEKRKKYIEKILSDSSFQEDVEEIVKNIEDIREKNDYSILQFGKRLPGSSYVVFEFGDKVIKLGKYYKVLNDSNILQPEIQIFLDNYNEYMAVYERVPEIFTQADEDIAQEMYNRVRNNGILWFDAIGYNVGRTKQRRDENDDGLRIIDAQYMEYERDVLLRINPEGNENYRNGGPGMYARAIRDYIVEKGYGFFEKNYQEMKEEKRKSVTKQDIEAVAKQSSMKGLKGIKNFLINSFNRKGKANER